MNRTISIVTPVLLKAAQFLRETYKSILDQELPPGWDWQWVVQEDGETGHIPELLPHHPHISFGQGRHGGAGVARTLALSRAEGALVKVLDADDLLTRGALARDIAVFQRYSDIEWTTSRVLDVLPGGRTIGFDGDPDEGPLERGAVVEYWRAHNYRASVHPATLCIRRDLLLALGGWMALPASEDTGLIIAANSIARGYFIGEAGLLYRKWDGQSTSQAAHADVSEFTARMAVIDARARSLAMRGELRFHPPQSA